MRVNKNQSNAGCPGKLNAAHNYFSVLTLFSCLIVSLIPSLVFGVLPVTTGIIGMSGLRASDWNNAGTVLYAAKTETIYRSFDSGNSWEVWYTFPYDPLMMSGYGQCWSLSIPTKLAGETTEMMLYSRYSDNSLWRCADINTSNPNFTKVLTSTHLSNGKHDWGTMCNIEQDNSGNLYLAGYAWAEPNPAGRLYKSTDRGLSWTEIKLWNCRHLHDVKFNTYNGWLYVLTCEHQSGFTESSKIFRSKDGGNTWTTVWSDFDANNINTLVPLVANFIDNKVIFGTESQGYASGATGTGDLYSFADDGSGGPFSATKVYNGVGGDGEIWWGETRMNGILYYASTGQWNTITAELVSSTDGINWTQIQTRSVNTSNFVDGNLGMITQHPNRGGRLIYSLSGNSGYYVKAVTTLPADNTPHTLAPANMRAAALLLRNTLVIPAGTYSLEILDVAGKLVAGESGRGPASRDLTFVKPGAYVLQLCGKGRSTARWIFVRK